MALILWTSSRRASTSARREVTTSSRETDRIATAASVSSVRRVGGGVGLGWLACEQLGPAFFLLSRAPGHSGNQRIGASGQALQFRPDVVEAAEVGHALGPGPELADRLRASEQEDGEDGEASWVKAETFVEHLAVPGGRTAVAGMDETKQAGLLQ